MTELRARLGAVPERISRRVPTGTEGPDGVVAWLVVVALEVEAGRRPLRHLEGLVSPALYRRLAARREWLRASGATARPPRGPVFGSVLAVRSQHPRPDVLEASVIVDRGDRVSALSVRLERHRGGWRIVDLSRPEDGGTPRRTSSLPAPAPPGPVE